MSMSAIQRRITNKARLGLAPKVDRKSANEKILKRKGKFLTETDLIAKRDIIGGRRLTVGYGVGGRVPNQQGGTKSQNAIAIDARSQNANGTGINILSRSSNGDSYITFQRDDPAQAAFASGDEWTAGLDAHGTTGGNRFKVSVSNALSTNDRFVLDLSGNSFIGINPPNSLSHSLELSKTSGDIAIDFDINGTDKFILGVDDDDGDKFKISGGGALGTNDRITIDSSGNVGIGTSAPNRFCQISDATQQAYDPSDAFPNQSLDVHTTGAIASQYASLCIRTTNTSSGTKNAYTFLNSVSHSTGDHSTDFTIGLREAGGDVNEKFRIESDGKVGIGEDDPDQILHIKGTNPQICIEESSTEFVRLGVEATGGDMCLGWDDADDMHLGVFSSVSDTTIDTKMTIKSDGTILGLGKDGYSTNIKVMPMDFHRHDDGANRYFYDVDDDQSNALSGRITTSSLILFAFVPIPNGYSATHVTVWADSVVSGGVAMFTYNHTTGVTTTLETGDTSVSGGTTDVIDITDVPSSATQSLVIKVALGGVAVDLFGADVTIAES